tara:strand:- start:1567 stop:2121 length:555 start_codon:yes stop_codon:yes gene_type:complete
MTTWPSANKGSTAHTDSEDDKPRLARPEINKNISNVNDIIDMFNIDSPADGDLLVYNSSTTKVELNSSNSNFTNLVQGPKETINAISANDGSVSVDAAAAPVHTMSLTGNTTYTFTNMVAGTSVLLIIKVNAADKSATLTSDGSTLIKFSGGAPTLTITSGQIDIVNVFFDGTDYIGSITQGIR